MRVRQFISIAMLLCGYCAAQTGIFVNGVAACLRVDSSGYLSVNGDFHNVNCDPVTQVRFNGSLYLAGNLINDDSLKFSATSGAGNSKKSRIIFRNAPTHTLGLNAVISGSANVKFWEVELNKPGGTLTLHSNVYCQDTLDFVSGNVYMNGFKWNLVDPVGAPSVVNHPFIKSERNGNQFMASGLSDTGLVVYHTIFTSSLNLNPANLGISLAGVMDLGSKISVVRGFKTQVNAGKSSIHKYFDITSPSYALTSATAQVRYSLNDLGYFGSGFLNLSKMRVFASGGAAGNWTAMKTLQASLASTLGPVSNGTISCDLSGLSHPNASIDGMKFRLTVADADCPGMPVSGLTADTVHICAGVTVTLDAGNNATVPNTSLKWEWNTVPPAYTRQIAVAPDNTYKKYTIMLTDVRGCVARDSIVVAPAAPYPLISYLNHLNSCIGDSIIIKDTVKIAAGTYTNFWAFSDGTSAAHKKNIFRKKFNTAGQHAYQLTATSNHGCSVTANASNVVVYPLPLVSFSSQYNCPGDFMTYSTTSISNHSSAVIASSLWNLGQGPSNTSSLSSPVQSYSASGTYSVKLVAVTSFGCRDSVVSQVVIHPQNIAAFIKNNTCYGDTVKLDNVSSCLTGSCSYSWELGDNTSSTSYSLSKVYSAAGFYSVKLKVTDPLGCPDSMSTAVFVNARPAAGFNQSIASLCPGEIVYCTNTSSISSGNIEDHHLTLEVP